MPNGNKNIWWKTTEINEDVLKSGLWKKKDTTTRKKSTVIRYNCKTNGCNLQVRKIVISTGFIYYEVNSTINHSCTLLNSDTEKSEIVKLITTCYETGQTTPMTIKKYVSDAGKQIKSHQIYYQLKKLKNSKGKGNTKYLQDIRKLLMNLQANNHNYLYFLDQGDFCCVVTHLDAIKKLKKARHFQIDYTYKLMDPDYKLMVFGFSDINRKFHPIMFGISQDELALTIGFMFNQFEKICSDNNIILSFNTLTADLAPQFDAMLRNNYPETVRLHCWFHVSKLIKSSISSELTNPGNIYSDICELQLMPTAQLFEYAYELFKIKYEQFTEFNQFLYSFEQNRILNNNLWYEGSQIWASSTNNGLESLNGKIKTNYLNRQIVQVNDFIKIAYKIFDDFKYDETIDKPKYTFESMFTDYKVILEEDVIIDGVEKQVTCFVLKDYEGPGLSSISFNEIQNFRNFNQMIAHYKTYIFVTNNKQLNSIYDIHCFCKSFLKSTQCQHVYHVICNKQRSELIDIPLMTRRSAGRPRKDTNHANSNYFLNKRK